MKSHINKEFRKCFLQLPDRIKKQARDNYRMWRVNPRHASLEFKRVSQKNPVYSVRVGLGWRALGIVYEDNIIGYWIGSHEDYNKRINKV